MAKLPVYISKVCGWLYDSPKLCKIMDNPKVQAFISLWNNKKLINAVLKEVRVSDNVLQVGATFGSQIKETAEKIGYYGKYRIVDIHPLQISRVEEKYKYLYPSMEFAQKDAAAKIDGKYDLILCYMLLHELPTVTKAKVVNNLLGMLKDRGRVVFVDYHNPNKWHPMRYVVRMFNRLYRPFVEKLWDREIHTFADKKTDFVWRKTTYFGRMYQKVVATKKASPREIIEKLEATNAPLKPAAIKKRNNRKKSAKASKAVS